MKKNILVFCLLFCLSTVFAGGPGSTGLNFLKIGVGARALGMGGAFSAVADDASAVYWNPAGLCQLDYQEISFIHLSWWKGINYQFLSYVHPIKWSSTLGASIYYLSVGDIPSYNNDGDKLNDDLKVSDLALVFSYSREIAGVDFGVNTKFIQENLADESANTYALDFGMLYRLKIRKSLLREGWLRDWISEECKLSLVMQNIGPGIKYIKEKDSLPLNYKIGIAQGFFNDSLISSWDFNFPVDDDFYINSGFDYRIADWVSLRIGSKLKSNKPKYDIQPELMGGIGLGNEYINIDYAFVPFSDLGNTHQFGLGWRFGRAYGKDLIEIKIEQRLKLAKKYYQKKDLISANREFKNVLIIDPVNQEAKKYLANIQSQIGKIKVGKYLELARIYLMQDKLIEAKELLDNILVLFPDHADTKGYLAEIENTLKEQKVRRVKAMFNQGIEFYGREQYRDAVSLLEKVLLINPGHEQAKEYISLAKQKLAKIEEEKKKKEQELIQKKADESYRKGVKFYKAQQWEKARQMFEESLKLRPGQKKLEEYLTRTKNQIAEKHYRRGLKYYKQKKLKIAIELWEKAVYFNPYDKKNKDSLTKARAEIKEINRVKAEEYSQSALKEYSRGNLKKAIELWEKAIGVDPENDKIRNNLDRAKKEWEKKK